MATEAQIAAAAKARPLVARDIAASAAKVRASVTNGVYDLAKIGASAETLLAAADRAEALIADADAKLVLDLRDAGKGFGGMLTDGQEHIPYLPLVFALAGVPKKDDRSHAINRIVAGL